ncbi:3912_t:CDS:2, partial [Scutellospora calospora]
LIHDTILCWFHIMSTLGKHLKMWKVKWPLRYLIALAFKIIGRSKTDEEAVKIGEEYSKFINSLGRMSQIYDQPNAILMTMNNLTERMYKTVEAQCCGIQIVVKFIERLYMNILEKINEIIIKLVNKENLHIPEIYYLVNTLSEALHGNLQMQEIKEKLVQHFKDKENA